MKPFTLFIEYGVLPPDPNHGIMPLAPLHINATDEDEAKRVAQAICKFAFPILVDKITIRIVNGKGSGHPIYTLNVP